MTNFKSIDEWIGGNESEIDTNIEEAIFSRNNANPELAHIFSENLDETNKKSSLINSEILNNSFICICMSFVTICLIVSLLFFLYNTIKKIYLKPTLIETDEKKTNLSDAV